MRIFQPSYTSPSTGKSGRSKTYHIAFTDHLGRRQTVAGYRERRHTESLQRNLERLIDHKVTGNPLHSDVRGWLDTIPNELRDRLLKMDLVDAGMVSVDTPLLDHLEEPEKIPDDEEEKRGRLPSYEEVIRSRGTTDAHVTAVIGRIRRVLVDCGFVFWRDLASPAAVTKIEVYLGRRRSEGKINGTSYGYFVRDLRTFCAWLDDTGRAPAIALLKLRNIGNADQDKKERRELDDDEMRWLINTANDGPVRGGVSGHDRALLYQFCYESGLRPRQVRNLVVANFDLEAKPFTVTAAAQYVKRRKRHTQVLTAGMARRLKEEFANKLPTATAIVMPNPHRIARILRADLADARAQWIKEAKSNQERLKRQRSDFLADVDHQGRKAVFYSLRHAHGSSLARAGASLLEIQRSMHHTSSKTTLRYLHNDQQDLASVVARLPNVSPKKKRAQ